MVTTPENAEAVPGPVLHDEPCPLANPAYWYRTTGDVWQSNWKCTCDESVPEVPPTPEFMAHWTASPQTPELSNLVANGGWAAPSDLGYDFTIPEVTVKRGGLSFSLPTPLTEWKKKDLVAEVERLRTTVNVVRANEASLKRKNRRLRRAIKRLIG